MRYGAQICNSDACNKGLSLKTYTLAPMFPIGKTGTAYGGSALGDWQVESIMKAREEWRQHLRDLVSASLDPMIYAVQWARDPRCMQRGNGHRRVGAQITNPVCRLWSKRG